MKKIVATAAAAIGLAAAYTVIPTYAIRLSSYGVVQRTDQKGILLTFDDGPNPTYTPQLLALLKQYNIRAIFFVVAEKAEKYPEIIHQMIADGHVIGLHHYTHSDSYKMTPNMLDAELLKGKQAIERVTQQPVHFYRPPWGKFTLATLPLAKKHALTPIMWSKIFGDWKVKTCQTTLQNKLHHAVKDGAIYVLHDCGMNPGADDEAPAFMLQQLEKFLRDKTALGQPFTEPTNWKRYVSH